MHCATIIQLSGVPNRDPGISLSIYPPRNISSEHYPCLLTWCRHFPVLSPPTVYSIKRSTVNVYKIDNGRSVRDRSIGLTPSPSYSRALKFVNSISPKWPHWTLLLTDFFMKIFRTSNIEIVKSCQEFFWL